MPSSTAAIEAALTQLKVPYVWGGESPGKGFDCSGLVQWAYGQVGIALPRTSQEQYTATTPVAGGQANAQPGDLVFSNFGEQAGQPGPGHVGIYIGNGQFIDAPFTGVDVRVDQVGSGAVFGRVNGLMLTGGSGTPAAGADASSSSTGGGSGCNGRTDSGGVDIFGAHIGTICNIKALTGGLLVGLGGFTLLVGAVLIASHGLANTGAARAVGKLPGPVGKVAKTVTGRARPAATAPGSPERVTHYEPFDEDQTGLAA